MPRFRWCTLLPTRWLVLLALLAVPAVSALTMAPRPARAALTLVVNSTGDGDDALNGDNLCQTATAGECTLRAAIEEANATAGTDTINFNIGGGGLQTIAPLSELPVISDPVVLDATTQPGYTSQPLIYLNGGSAGSSADGFRVNADGSGSAIYGFTINRFTYNGIEVVNATDVTIDGNYIGTDVTGTIAMGNFNGILMNNAAGTVGGPLGNVISGNGYGVEVFGPEPGHPSGNVIRGNKIGVTATGTAAAGNLAIGVLIHQADANTIGGTTPGDRNIISGNGTGVVIRRNPFQAASNFNVIEGNYIGTDASGAAALPNGYGVIVSSGQNTVGGTAGTTPGGPCTGACNVISGNTLSGVRMENFGNVIAQGNFIGPNAAGTALVGNGHNGVEADGLAASTIGGTAAGAGNIIAGNGRDGVGLSGASASISANSIHSNAALGINLVAASDPPSGVTPNDPGDIDTGPNGLQNFPVVTGALSSGGSTTVYATLNSAASRPFSVEFFSSASCDPSGFGEGQTLIGSTMAVTDFGGDATLNATFPIGIAPGTPVTATARDSSGNTSEFSSCHRVELDSDGDGCTDAMEMGPDHRAGGQRDPNNPWDFFDVPAPVLQPGFTTGTRNRVVSISDVLAIVYYIGTADGASPNANGVSYNTDLNANGVPDGQEYDRTPSTTPGQPWRSNAPDGAVSIQDALVALNQVGTNCS